MREREENKTIREVRGESVMDSRVVEQERERGKRV
jgi:hypothetical protein